MHKKLKGIHTCDSFQEIAKRANLYLEGNYRRYGIWLRRVLVIDGPNLYAYKTKGLGGSINGWYIRNAEVNARYVPNQERSYILRIRHHGYRLFLSFDSIYDQAKFVQALSNNGAKTLGRNAGTLIRTLSSINSSALENKSLLREKRCNLSPKLSTRMMNIEWSFKKDSNFSNKRASSELNISHDDESSVFSDDQSCKQPLLDEGSIKNNVLILNKSYSENDIRIKKKEKQNSLRINVLIKRGISGLRSLDITTNSLSPLLPNKELKIHKEESLRRDQEIYHSPRNVDDRESNMKHALLQRKNALKKFRPEKIQNDLRKWKILEDYKMASPKKNPFGNFAPDVINNFTSTNDNVPKDEQNYDNGSPKKCDLSSSNDFSQITEFIEDEQVDSLMVRKGSVKKLTNVYESLNSSKSLKVNRKQKFVDKITSRMSDTFVINARKENINGRLSEEKSKDNFETILQEKRASLNNVSFLRIKQTELRSGTSLQESSDKFSFMKILKSEKKKLQDNENKKISLEKQSSSDSCIKFSERRCVRSHKKLEKAKFLTRTHSKSIKYEERASIINRKHKEQKRVSNLCSKFEKLSLRRV